jgi:hypothetical protein
LRTETVGWKTIPGSRLEIHHNMQKSGENRKFCEEIFKKKAGKISPEQLT